MVKNKSSLGRQKIPMEKIPNQSHLQVTFSKRRSGLFKKASELCTLCGVQILLMVFSPAGKLFSFGHPDIESIVHRYLTRNPPLNSGIHKFVEAQRNLNIHDLNMQLSHLLNQLDIEKNRGEMLDRVREVRQRQFWWERGIDELGLQELEKLKFSMEELKNNVIKQVSNVSAEHAANGIGHSEK
ncbi:hypothetical protein L6164_001156 [Bauhinia variegata]|uniref:Uncharacterized protein n=1 Tax=Bauhinia variegata TaxID=167791 RepID=A0ACB9Q882_BAUVA|nr:hypothetical protein L6164_001156 [Bauhinia variegata]